MQKGECPTFGWAKRRIFVWCLRREWIFFHKDGLRLNAAKPDSAIDDVPMLGQPSGILWNFLIPSEVVRGHRTPAGQPTGVAYLSQADGRTLRGPPKDCGSLAVRMLASFPFAARQKNVVRVRSAQGLSGRVWKTYRSECGILR
jgi:hypothetical protein